jgi:putative transposase
MSVFTLSVGLVVRLGERTWRLERELEDGTLVFVDQVTGRPMSTDIAKLWGDLNAKRLAIVAGDSAPREETLAARFVVDWASLPDSKRALIERQLEYVRAAQRQGLRHGMRHQIKALIEKGVTKIEDPHKPSESTVMLWMRRIEMANGSPAALISGHVNRKQRQRLPAKVVDIAREALASHYCTRQRPSLTQTAIHVERELQRAVASNALLPEQARISPSTLRRLKEQIDPYRRDVARFGAAYTRNRWRYSLAGAGATRAMQRYEVDHTIVDLVAVCDRTGLPLGRPTITVVVDTYSSYVVGFFVSFWGTGLATTFAALKVALSPKADYVKAMGLAQPWLGMGLPELLVLDNGLEFHSQQFRSVALHLAIDLQYCPVRQPWLKPHVERCLGSYLSYLPSAGRVRKAATNEIPLRPDETAAVTFSDLCQGLLKAFVEAHAMQVNERKLARPFDLFSESLEALPPPALPTSLEELDIIVAPSKSLTVANEGVVSDYLRFNSVELQELRRQTAERFKTLVKFNPEDLGSVWVQDPRQKGWLKVPCCAGEYANGLSLIQHRAIRTAKRDELNRRDATAVLLRAKTELIDLWQSRSLKSKRLKSTQLRALAGLTSSHSFRGDATKSEGPQVPTPVVLTDTDLAAAPRAIPEFDAFEF